MEQQEEKKRKIQRNRTATQSETTLSLPLDLTPEILSKLPPKSIVRFRCVSKLWSSVTIDPYFTKSFEALTRPRLLLFFKKDDKFFVFSIPQHNQNPNESFSYSSSQPIDSYCTTYPRYLSFTVKAESVHGLISFQKSTTPIIWNPSMRKFLSLPKPKKSWKGITVFLGYDPIDGKHKVVCFPHFRTYNERSFQILTLGSDQGWRSIETNHNHGGNQTRIYGTCIKGVLYYEAELANTSRRVVMSFDVRSEILNVTELPMSDHDVSYMKMISYEGRLAYVGSTETNITIWTLEDAEKHEWSHRTFSLAHYSQDLPNTFTLKGMTNDGELIYAPKTVFKSFHVIYIDPKRNTFRKVKYDGIVDEDFRKRNGLGDKRLRGLQFYPNHIETLMSL